MIKAILTATGLTLSATAAIAQSCDSAIITPDPCLTGAWIGTNTAMQKIQAMLQSMPTGPSTTRNVFAEGFAEVLGMQVYADGFYATLPIHRDVHMDEFTTTNDDTIHVQTDMTLVIGSTFGYIWGSGGQLHYCTDTSAGSLLTESQSSHGGGGSNLALFGGPGDAPNITYSCAGDSWNFTVDLPQPVGPVDYYLTRVPMSAFDEEMRELLESRFAPADGFDDAGNPLPTE